MERPGLRRRGGRGRSGPAPQADRAAPGAPAVDAQSAAVVGSDRRRTPGRGGRRSRCHRPAGRRPPARRHASQTVASAGRRGTDRRGCRYQDRLCALRHRPGVGAAPLAASAGRSRRRRTGDPRPDLRLAWHASHPCAVRPAGQDHAGQLLPNRRPDKLAIPDRPRALVVHRHGGAAPAANAARRQTAPGDPPGAGRQPGLAGDLALPAALVRRDDHLRAGALSGIAARLAGAGPARRGDDREHARRS